MGFSCFTRWILSAFLLLSILSSKPSFADDLVSKKKGLTEKDVIESTIQHYPHIMSLYESVKYAENEVLENQGFFDIKLKQSFTNRSRGFYDGETSDTRISRSNQFLGSEVFAGYRKSSGNFPIYEDNNITNGQGEYYAGIKFSLLQNRTIDDPRLKLLLARLDVKENQTQVKAIQNKIAQDALIYYWRWVASGNTYKLYQELYELAAKRQEKMTILFNKGDVSKIVLIENERNVLNRKRKLVDAQRIFKNNSIYLSLFIRDSECNIMKISESDYVSINLKSNITPISPINFDKDINFALRNRPDINILRIKSDKERNKIKNAENLNKPKFDVSFKTSKDSGSGSMSRRNSENIVKAELEIPLQRRMAKGQIGKYNANLRKIKYQKQLLSEKVEVEIKQLRNSINLAIEIHSNIQKEIELSKILQESEVVKLKKGSGDFFLINLREQELFNARLALLKIYEKYQEFFITYKASTFQLI